MSDDSAAQTGPADPVVSKSNRERVAKAIGRLWWLPLLRGILLIVLGSYALFQPGMTIGALAQLVGAFLIAGGVLSMLAGMFGNVPSRSWTIFRGMLEILIGVFVFANPLIVAGVTATFLVYMLAIAAIGGGILEICAAIEDRKQMEGEGWLILSGALSILIGIVLLLAPLVFGLLMVRVLGGVTIFAGIGLMMFAFRLRGISQRLEHKS